MKRAIVVILLVAAVGGGAGAYYLRRGGGEPQVSTAPIGRGDIVDTVGSTGALQAVNTVQVGSQVSGNISWLGADFNSIVKKGQVIAKLDPSLFEAQLQQAKANLGQTRANLVKAQSDLDRTKVQLVDAQQKLARAMGLAAAGLETQSDLDSAKIAVDTAQAAVASQQATVTQTQAAIAQSEASVNQNQVNLDHTIIAAPIDGIVTQRSVDVGQTVAASMQAPTLFIIAADLTKMQVNANIDEADVGRIRPGQTVTFRVDAYPTEEFTGTVSQIRLQPVVVQNVTTYGTIIDVPNPALKLKPGMTANLKVQIAKAADVVRVPNAAIRFRPNADVFAAFNQPVPPEAQAGGGRGGRGGFGGNGGRAGRNGGADAPAAATAASAAEPASTTAPAGAAPGGQRPADGEAGGRFGRGGRGGRDGASGEGAGRMQERFKSLAPADQQQFIARLKARGQDTSALEALVVPAATAKSGAAQAKYGTVSGQTIDALFAPLPPVESVGRVWLFVDKQLKPVRLRLGITDGTYTELKDDQLQAGMDVVTGVVLPASTRTANAPAAGNPLLQGGGRGGFGGPPGGGFGGGGRGR